MATTSDSLQTELNLFAEKLPELLRQAEGKFALIKGRELLGIYDTELAAVRAGYERLGNEAFLVKRVVEAEVPLNFTSFNLGV